MKTIAAKDAKNGFGRMLDTAQREPVTIEKHGRPVAVVLSLEEYQRLEALDDAYWAARAQQAVEEGDWLGPEESERFTRQLLDAED
jgi:antitoxin Phd